MILDSTLSFETAGTFTAITTSRASTNVLDLLNARDLGIGDSPALQLVIVSNGLFAASGAGTLLTQFQGAPDNGSGAPGTYTTYAETPALAIATLNSVSIYGSPYILGIDLPQRPAGVALPRFLRLNYTVATGPFTAGAIQAYISLAKDDIVAYPSGYSTQYI